ncbi:MAG TPA: ester cyclase [Acidimicrobiales bacterium]|nr:ester cyclase [Acidimicrobiales bacterium]
MSAESARALFQRYFDDGTNAGDLSVVDEVFAEDYRHFDPANPDPNGVVGRDGVREHITTLRGAFPDIAFHVDDMITEGDEKIVVRWHATLTHTGDYFGIPPTGKPATITGMNTWHLANGQAVEGWVNRDDLGLLQQLGIIPTPGN